MLKIPLSEQDIVNVKDEYALVMDIWIELKRLADKFTQECTEIQNNHKSCVEQMQISHTAQIQRMLTLQSQEISSLEYEKISALEQWENKYKNDQHFNNQKKENARKENNRISSDSAAYRVEMQKQVENRKKKLQEYLTEIQRAESVITARRYLRIARKGTDFVEVNATTMEQIISQNPLFKAKEINELNEQLIRKIIHPSLLRGKCIEFFSLKCKAKELYDKEVREQDEIIPDVDKKVSKMVSEARNRMNSELQNLAADAEQTKQEYINYCLELEKNFAERKKELLLKHEQKKAELLNAQENEKQSEKQMWQDSLVKSLKSYRDEHLYNLPPEVLKKYVDRLMARKIYRSQGFRTAQEEPLNITVGYVYFKFEQFLNNKIADKFMSEHYGFILKNGCFVFPYTVALNESLALCYKYNNKMSEIAKRDMQTLCLNAFLATPPNKMRFHFIDPLKSGQSFAMFKHFEEENSTNYNVILGGIQTESSAIEQQLQIVVEHIKTMQVNTFKGQYRNIREYNASNKLNPQPYNIIGVMDFPAGFTAKSIELLSQVVATGKECGVYVIIMSGAEQLANVEPKMKGIVANIEQMCTTFQMVERGYVLLNDGERNDDILYMIDAPLDIEEVVKLAPVMRLGIKQAGRIVIDYKNIAPPQAKYLKYNTNEGISIPIGMSGASTIQQLNLGMPGSQSVHALICGQIGSGKSRLLHTIITGALLQYPKEELQIYLVDFKSGTEFKIYADYNLPNFKVIAIESEQEFGLSVLRDIKKEGERRAQIFNECTKSDITSYNNSPCVESHGYLPRVLIVIDEFHMMFSNGNHEVAMEASLIMDEILRLNRSYGFHIVLCSQSIRGMNAINEAALAQIAVRIALKCPKEDADIVLGKGSDSMKQIEENDAGSAIYLSAISSPKINNKFRVGYLSPENHMKILRMLDTFYNEKGQKTNARVLVSDVSDSRNSIFQKYVADGEVIAKERVLHLGEPLKVESNLEVRFDAMPGNHLLLLGKNNQKAQNMLFFITLDLVLQGINQRRKGSSPQNIYVINYCDGANSDFDDKIQDFGLKQPERINYYDGFDASNGIEDIYKRFETKTLGEADDWLIISNLALASELQSTSVYGSYRENANRFERLLEQGPMKGVFVVAWCDDPVLFRAKFNSTLEYFGKRVIFNVSEEDALSMADVVKDDSINKNNAYLYQSGRGKEKFRPYSTPMDSWINRLCTERLDKEKLK